MNSNTNVNKSNDFRKKLLAKVADYEQDFSNKIKESIGSNSANRNFWIKSFKKLSAKHSLALRKILFYTCFFKRKHYQNSSSNTSQVMQEPYELLQSCHDSFVFKLNQFLEQKQLDDQSNNYVASLQEFTDEIKKISNETIIGFDSLFKKTACVVDCLPKKMIEKTDVIQKKIKAKIADYCSSIYKQHANRYMVSRKKAINGKSYSVLKARKRITNFSRRAERIFWKYEIEKVNLVNKPHTKQPEMANVPKDSLLLKNVYKFYSNNVYTYKVLNNVNLEIKLGEFVVIFGSSGSGKTTLLNLISGMDRASAGHIYCAGTNLIKLSNNGLTKFRRKNVGYIFQQYGLLPNLTVRENVEVGSNLQRDYSKKIDINLLLNDVGMLNKKDSLPIELSGGQQQRVSIARAIAKHPLIIFADEPTAALDDATTKVIMNLFLNLNEKYKITFVVVSHNSLFGELADKVIHVNDGEIKSIVVQSNK